MASQPNTMFLLLWLLSYQAFAVVAWTLELRPDHFHVMMMMDTTKTSLDEQLLTRLQAVGVDSFVVDSKAALESDLTLLGSQQCCPLPQRSEITNNKDAFMLWQVSSADPTVEAISTDPTKEAFVICGDDAFVIQTMNRLLPAGAHCLWRPPSTIQQQFLSRSTSPISVWRLRSNPGILGIVLDDVENADIGSLSACLRKLRQPCSAMDYPPTIFMVGEDEIR